MNVSDTGMSNITKVVDRYVEVFDADQDSYVLHPWTWLDPQGGTPHYVFILPVVALVALVTNITIGIVIVKEKLVSSANIIMIGIAVSDTLTVLSPTPLLVTIYWQNFAKEVPFDLCVVWEYFMKNICAVTHTASVWLTMYLGINRYLGICHPFVMRRRCTIKSTVQTIFFIYTVSVLFHLCRFVDTKYVPEFVSNSSTNTCSARYADWVGDVNNQRTYECIYYWCHIICISIIPCSVLLILDTIMLRQIRKSEIKRSIFQTENQKEASKRKQSDSIRTTKIIVTILAIVCVLELSLGTILALWTLNMMGYLTISEDILGRTSTFIHFAIYISYPFIFLLYCRLSSQFKKGISGLLSCESSSRRKRTATQSLSLKTQSSLIIDPP
ncbi:unnamed protein product [Mytilus edulis]|uniref:G-protein coupled receptors family 1 profile domain-containing protein n=1 Tax=Mytilus edulis TaxID=6550 RepID=A0A8S3PZZ5_MYTED|nr:unnamed protein product [Mytilus edulis]